MIRNYEGFISVLRKLRGESFDLVWAERPHIGRLCGDFHAKAIIDLDDIEHIKVARARALERSSVARVRSAYRYHFYRHIELTWARRFLSAIVCSETDRQYMAKHGCNNVIVVPNAPNTTSNQNIPPMRVAQSGAPIRMLFLGNVTSLPNADSIEYFSQEILPLLRQHHPQAELDVIGPEASDALRQKYKSKINFLGFVPDLQAAMVDYDMLVAPLRFGSGTKLKVLDAMRHGLPVVTTAVGAEGLDVEHGRHVWLAEKPEEIVAGILRLKQDVDLAQQLSRNAYELVLSKFSWDAIQDQLVLQLEALLARIRAKSGAD